MLQRTLTLEYHPEILYGFSSVRFCAGSSNQVVKHHKTQILHETKTANWALRAPNGPYEMQKTLPECFLIRAPYVPRPPR